MAKRMIETNITEEDIRIEGSLRPQMLDDFNVTSGPAIE